MDSVDGDDPIFLANSLDVATAPDSMTKKSPVFLSRGEQHLAGLTVRTRASARNRARRSSARPADAPSGSTISATPAPIGRVLPLTAWPSRSFAGTDPHKLTPRAVESLPVHEESRRATDCGPPASGDVGEDALPKAVLAKRRVGLLFVQVEPPRRREQILLREPLAAGE